MAWQLALIGCLRCPVSPHFHMASARSRTASRHWVLSASCLLLYTRRLAACRLPTLVHGQEIPMELWCYIGQASPGTVCLALTDTKQWVLFLLPRSRSGMVLLGHLGCGRVYVESQRGFHPSSISVNSLEIIQYKKRQSASFFLNRWLPFLRCLAVWILLLKSILSRSDIGQTIAGSL